MARSRLGDSPAAVGLDGVGPSDIGAISNMGMQRCRCSPRPRARGLRRLSASSSKGAPSSTTGITPIQVTFEGAGKHPIIGSGKRLFSDGTIPSGLKLVDSKVSTTGVVIGTYEPAGEFLMGSFALD